MLARLRLGACGVCRKLIAEEAPESYKDVSAVATPCPAPPPSRAPIPSRTRRRASHALRRAAQRPDSRCLCADSQVDTCHAADISRKCVRLRPVICIKG